MSRVLLTEMNHDVRLFDTDGNGFSFHIDRCVGAGASCVVYHAVREDNTEHLLKEYYPKHIDLYRERSGELCIDTEEDTENFEYGMQRFVAGYERQNSIRRISELKNATSNIQGIYHANGTRYIDMTCFHGQTYDKIQETSVYDLLRRMKAVAQIVGNYHKAGFLHLDIKPENIFTIPETCEMVMLFDFDSVTEKSKLLYSPVLSYTKTWAAPEQLNPNKCRSICEATDLFAIGEMIFHQITGRHSTELGERRSTTAYSFDAAAPIFKNVNPRIFPMLCGLFQRTICGLSKNRFQTASELIQKLDEIIKLADPKEPYIKKALPTVQNFFIGRDGELEEIHHLLQENDILFLNGIGGIGKSELAKQYAHKYQDCYDSIAFAPYVGNTNMLIQDDSAIQINNFTPYPEENPEDYCTRKLRKLKELCDARTLIVIDNLDRNDDTDFKKLLGLGCKLLITTRADFSKFGLGTQFRIDALKKPDDINKIFFHHYDAELNDDDRKTVKELIGLVAGHTMTVELIAKQIGAEWATPADILEKLKSAGIHSIGDADVDSGKDGTFSSQSTYNHIKALFDLSVFEKAEKENDLYVLNNLCLIPYTGIDGKLFAEWTELKDHGGMNTINRLVSSGWVRRDGQNISLHPVVAEVVMAACFDYSMWDCFLDKYTDDIIRWRDLEANRKATIRFCAYHLMTRFSRERIICEKVIDALIILADFFRKSLYDFYVAYQAIQYARQKASKSDNIEFPKRMEIIINFGVICSCVGDVDGDLSWQDKAIAAYLEVIEDEHFSLLSIDLISVVYQNIADAFACKGTYSEAIRHFEKALMLRKQLIESDNSEINNTELSIIYNNMGIMYRLRGNYDEAVRYYRLALPFASKFNAKTEGVAKLYHDIARAMLYSHSYATAEAEKYAKQSLDIRLMIWSEDSYYLAMSRAALAEVFCTHNDAEHMLYAQELFQKAIPVYIRTLGEDHKDTQNLLKNKAEIDRRIYNAVELQ